MSASNVPSAPENPQIKEIINYIKKAYDNSIDTFQKENSNLNENIQKKIQANPNDKNSIITECFNNLQKAIEEALIQCLMKLKIDEDKSLKAIYRVDTLNFPTPFWNENHPRRKTIEKMLKISNKILKIELYYANDINKESVLISDLIEKCNYSKLNEQEKKELTENQGSSFCIKYKGEIVFNYSTKNVNQATIDSAQKINYGQVQDIDYLKFFIENCLESSDVKITESLNKRMVFAEQHVKTKTEENETKPTQKKR